MTKINSLGHSFYDTKANRNRAIAMYRRMGKTCFFLFTSSDTECPWAMRYPTIGYCNLEIFENGKLVKYIK